jgi:hypothetical protein
MIINTNKYHLRGLVETRIITTRAELLRLGLMNSERLNAVGEAGGSPMSKIIYSKARSLLETNPGRFQKVKRRKPAEYRTHPEDFSVERQPDDPATMPRI